MKMADIDLVIKIPEAEYKKFLRMKPEYFEDTFCYIKAIQDGIVLSKGHGRLIDAKEFEAYIRDGFLDLKGLFKTEKYRGLAEQLNESFLLDIQEQATIVPEDKEESE